ncbi:MAG TPA: hypothetical protein VHP30_12180, partial [Ignavibacteriales bacterium]|nr:hypothetical protein [Ignavibacteriales bacterium]
MPKVILLIFLLSAVICAQPVLKKEQIRDNSYSLQISLEDSEYSIINKNGKDYIYFDGYADEQKPGQPSLPAKDVFIAIPYGPNPQVSFTNVTAKTINALPLINPQIKVVDKQIKYEEYLGAPKMPQNQNDILLKGFLWIGENYCAHIQVNEYRYNINEGSITKIESFAVEFKFVQPLPAKAPPALQKSTQAKIFINSEYASSIKGHPLYKTQSSGDWIDYSRTYLKIGVAADGIYRIYPEDLSASGVNVSFINPKQIKLINNGTEQPIYVSGEDDGSIDADDYIEFIGLRNMGGKHRETSREGGPYNEYLGRYTDTTIYWLSWEGEYGKRASIKDSSLLPAIGELVYYTEVIHKETNKMFDFSMQDEIEKAMPFWSSAKTWNEISLGVGEKSVEYVLSDVYANGQARIFSKLQDLASNYYTNAHLLGMTLNADTTIYDKKFINKYEQTVLTGELNSSLLANGS